MIVTTQGEIIEALMKVDDIREDLISAGWMMAQYLCHLPTNVLGEAFEAIGRYAEAERRLDELEKQLADILGPVGGDDE